MTAVVADRLLIAQDFSLGTGAHECPSKDEPPCGACVMELFAWVTGQAWTDDPGNCCPVVGAMLRRFNDATDQAGRDRLGAWVFAHLPELEATAKDGRQSERGYMAADYAVRIALPLWLDLAGATDAARSVRELAPITDRASAAAGRVAAQDAREGLPNWWAWRSDLRERVRVAVKEALKDRPAAVAAAADAVAVAVAAAAADADAVAAAAADAVAAAAANAVAAADAAAAAVAVADAAAAAAAAAVAVADADAAAAADAVAVADAAAAADAAADTDAGTPYSAVYKAVRARLDAQFRTAWAPAVVPAQDAFFLLCDRMVAA